MQTDLHLKIVEMVKKSGDEDQLLRSVSNFCQEMGVENFFFVSSLFNTSTTTPDLRVLSSFPDAWQSRYHEANYMESDLTIRHSREKNSPLVWLDSVPEIDKTNKKMFAEASEFGVISGITFPYHGIGCEFGSMSGVVSQEFKKSALDSINAQFSLYLLGTALFDLHYSDKDNDFADKLTQREKECLRWAAEGKTSWEMSVILNISERTACFHLDNARKKLNSLTRTGAVSKALLHSLL